MNFKFFLSAFFSLIVLTVCVSGEAIPKLVAHRGEVLHRGDYTIVPENTLPAFKLAWKNGYCWAVETDVHLTKDKVLICSHDTTTKCKTGTDWRIKDKTFAELRTLSANRGNSHMWDGVKLPSLQEVLETVPRNGHIFIEIKSAGPGFEKPFKEAVLASGVANDQITVLSFFKEELKNFRKMFPHLRTIFLMGGKPSTDDILKMARSLGVIGVSLHKSLITKERVEILHKAGLEVHVWTVDDIAEAREMKACGVDSITTNRCKELYEALK